MGEPRTVWVWPYDEAPEVLQALYTENSRGWVILAARDDMRGRRAADLLAPQHDFEEFPVEWKMDDMVLHHHERLIKRQSLPLTRR